MDSLAGSGLRQTQIMKKSIRYLDVLLAVIIF
jgi:hypothetical protein